MKQFDNIPDFQTLRDSWALRAPLPGRDQVQGAADLDRAANPNNEEGPDKRPRRSEAEIISDICYTFSDRVLTQQYGTYYQQWLDHSGYEDRWRVTARYYAPKPTPRLPKHLSE